MFSPTNPTMHLLKTWLKAQNYEDDTIRRKSPSLFQDAYNCEKSGVCDVVLKRWKNCPTKMRCPDF